MKILLDESLPKRLKKHFSGHVVKTVSDMGWKGKQNGELMSLIAGKFDIFVTPDQNMIYQINLRHAVVPIFVLKASSNRYDDLKLLIPELLKTLKFPIIKKINIFE
jgi:predicted nuclease of predicted toxin-antitoxin system